MDKQSSLLEYEDNWRTQMGAWFPGERVVFRGKDLFSELNDMPWMGLLLFGITGRIFNSEEIRLFEGLWVLSASYPEPRLWNNRVASLTGTAKSTGSLGISAATAVSEAKIYGKQADIAAIDFIQRAVSVENGAGDLDSFIKNELKVRRVIGGFGRPIVKTDERIGPVMKLMKDLGFDPGEHVKLALEIERLLEGKRLRMRLNVGGLVAAIASDFGLSLREYYYYVLLAFSAGHIPCFIDAQDNKREGQFLPLRCSRVAYEGIALRKWEK